MEIIHIILGKANPERMNGVNKVVYQLATQQTISGRKVSVWGITKNTLHNYGNRNFKTNLFPAKKNIFHIDQKLVEQIIKAKKRKAVFHLHGGWIPTFFTVSSLLSKHNIPFVFTPHGAYNIIAMTKSKWMKKIYFQVFEKQLLRRASAIHCIGKSEVEGIQSIIKTSNTFLMPYGFETESLPPRITDEKKEDFIIGFVGRMDIYTKGLDLLLDAFEAFQKKEKNAKLWIVGDSDERPNLEKMIATKKLQNEVILWGSKFGKEKQALLRKMHVFAHPSRNEGLPSSVLEAASMGIPCLITEATNVGEFIRRYSCGESVKNENSDAITQALFRLNENRKNGQLEMLGQRAQKMVKEEFNWNHIVNEFDKLYTDH
ncbi:MAG: glycosyltransferase involved in cell wall biosynthesis [Polaribacter sp.]|jgi:glycosyltransferase involved in cell wall biosynthesis